MPRFALLAMLTVPMLAACGEDLGPQTCNLDIDCNGGTCDAVTGSCTCTPSACSAMGLECLDDGTCGTAGMMTPDMGMTGCGVAGTQGTCAMGETCQADGTCMADVITDCTPAGQQASCAAGEVCLPSGMCEMACDNGGADGCLSREQLCVADTTSAIFNSCGEPQLATGACPNAMLHSRAPGGPIIAAITSQGSLMSSMNCTGNASVQRFAADVVLTEATDMLPSSLFTMGIKNLGPDGMLTGTTGRGLTFSEGAGTPSHPTATAVPMEANRFVVEFSLCLSDAQMMQQLGIYIQDDEGEASNAACFLAQ